MTVDFVPHHLHWTCIRKVSVQPVWRQPTMLSMYIQACEYYFKADMSSGEMQKPCAGISFFQYVFLVDHHISMPSNTV